MQEEIDQKIEQLASLSSTDYAQLRKAESVKLDVPVEILDKAVSLARNKKGGDMVTEVEPWPDPVDGAALLDEVYTTIKQFIVCEDETARTATLWTAFTWFIDHVQVAPLAIITAPEKRCGKTQLLELMGKMSCRAVSTSNISPAVIFRIIEGYRPTLMIDEVDAFLKDNEAARGILNSGHTRQMAFVYRSVGDDHEPKKFSTWGAKALCGIGKMSETLMDRAVILELRRKLPTEKVAKQRHANPATFTRLSRMLARFAEDCGLAVKEARPDLPEELGDRAQDNWEPLLAIAEQAGGEWPKKAREAALKISGTAEEATSGASELLADIREVLSARPGMDRFSTKILLDELNSDDLKPWSTYNHGKPLSPAQLARKLKDYGIKSKQLRLGGVNVRGYERKAFADALMRYLPSSSDTPEAAATPLQDTETPINTKVSPVADSLIRSDLENASATLNPLQDNGCSGVAGKRGSFAEPPLFDNDLEIPF